MRFVAPILAAALVGACASSARADRAFMPGAAVTALDTSAHSLAAGVAWTPRACEHLILWQPPLFSRYTFTLPGPCPETSTGRGIAAVSVTGSRVVFLSYVGGNTREWRLWTATPTKRAPRLLRTATSDADSPSPIVVGNGGRFGIPYAVGRDVVLLAGDGSRRLSWKAPAPVIALAENGLQLALALANGDVVVLDDENGDEVDHASFPAGDILAVRPIAGGFVVQTKQGIRLQKSNVVRDLSVPARARMVGYVDGWVVYLLGGDIRAYSWQKKQDVLIRHVGGSVLADDDANGLGWASGRTLCWSTRAYVFSRVHPTAPGCGR